MRFVNQIFSLSLIKNSFLWIKWYFEDSQKSLTNRFDFLDGYRGFCALVVVLNHLVPHLGNDSDFLVFRWTGHFIGVFGFFVLSAFLLTYRMSRDLQKTTSLIEILEILLKYLIRRFFRIYIPFLAFVACVKLGPDEVRGGYGYESVWSFMTLKPTIINHLWSIPIEIRYYFLIPLFCLGFYYSKKFWPITTLLSIGIVYSLFNTIIIFNPGDISRVEKNNLFLRFPIFYSGTVCAFLYFKFEQLEGFIKTIFKTSQVRFLLGLIGLLMGIYGIKNFSPYYNTQLDFYKDLFHPGAKFALMLFVMLIGAPNDFTRIFGNNFILQKMGKYSFGVYLWHPMCIVIVGNHQIIKRLDKVALVVGLSYLCGILFYYLIENPSMKLGNILIARVNFRKRENSNLV